MMAAVRGAEPSVERSGPPLRGVDCGAHPAKPRMRPVVIVVETPAVEYDTGVRQRPEQGLVEQFTPQATDEGFGKGILHWLARRDVVPVDFVVVGPAQDGVRGQL